MIKRFAAMLLAAIVCLALAGCQSGSAPDKDAPADSTALPAAQEAPENETKTLPEAEPETETQPEAEAQTEAQPETEAPDSAARYAAYQFVLQQIAFEHVYPDGTDVGFDGYDGFIEDNFFALLDLTGDGADELIVQFVTAPMAGNAETVYTYNEADDTVEPLLTLFPAVTYYENGLVKADLSHNHGLAGDDYWPYELYRYQADTGTYELIAAVDMWSRSVSDVGQNGEAYPEDIDTENAGTVFIVTQNDVSETMSQSDFVAWLSALLDNAAVIEPPYQSLSEANIAALCG